MNDKNKVINKGDNNNIFTGNTINTIMINELSKKSDSITKLIQFLSDNLKDDNSIDNIHRTAETENKMDENDLSDDLREEIRSNYGVIKTTFEDAFLNFNEKKILNWINSYYRESLNNCSSSIEIWECVNKKVHDYVITHNADNLIEDYEADYPIRSLLIYAFVKCKLLKNPEENNNDIK